MCLGTLSGVPSVNTRLLGTEFCVTLTSLLTDGTSQSSLAEDDTQAIDLSIASTAALPCCGIIISLRIIPHSFLIISTKLQQEVHHQVWQHESSAAIAAVTKSVETVLCPIPTTLNLRGATLYRVRCPVSKLTTSRAFQSDCNCKSNLLMCLQSCCVAAIRELRSTQTISSILGLCSSRGLDSRGSWRSCSSC